MIVDNTYTPFKEPVIFSIILATTTNLYKWTITERWSE